MPLNLKSAWNLLARPRDLRDRLGQALAAEPPPPLGSILIGVGCALLSFLFRYAASGLLGDNEAFLTAFPLVLVSGLLGGQIAGWTFLAANVIGSWYLFIGKPMTFSLGPHEAGILAGSVVVGAIVVGIAAVLRDTFKELAFAHEKDRLLSRELRHRVKNTLTLVVALSRQIFRSGRTIEAARDDFEQRIVALANAHELVGGEDQRPTCLASVVEGALSPFLGTTIALRADIRGPELRLTPDAATGLFLVIHELATNAAKYGALSVGEGRLGIAWRVEGDGKRRAALTWVESGGPPVREPTAKGFGSQLLDRVVVRQFNGAAKTRYLPGGLEVDLAFPLDRRTFAG